MNEPYKPNPIDRAGKRRIADVATRRSYDQRHSKLEFFELNEFPKSDPWHSFFEGVIRKEARVFSGKTILEGGTGNGSLMLEAIFATQDQGLQTPERIIGVDKNATGLDLAYHHLQQVGHGDRTELWHGGIIQFLELHDQIPAQVGVFCLPQVPQPHRSRLKEKLRMSESDSYDPAFVPTYAHKYNDVGLGLIGATLTELHDRVPNDFTGYFIFSDRIPTHRIDDMIADTGWEIREEFRTPQPIQHDPDTKLDAYAYIKGQDDSHPHFFELKEGAYHPISTQEAIDRVNVPGVTRDTLNVYHHLSVLKLQKAGISGLTYGRRGAREYV